MSSVPPRSAGEDDQRDLTAQARIRNTAITHFARDGFQKANVRAIAADAGVSVGLVFHHFGNKDGLRRACDDHVVRVVSERGEAAANPSRMPDLLGVYLADPEGYQAHARYLARAIQEDTPNAEALAASMVEATETILRDGAADGTLRESSDPRAAAVFAVLISLATLTMPASLAKTLGQDGFGPETLRRLAVPTMELYTHGFYVDDTVPETAGDTWETVQSPRQKER